MNRLDKFVISFPVIFVNILDKPLLILNHGCDCYDNHRIRDPEPNREDAFHPYFLLSPALPHLPKDRHFTPASCPLAFVLAT